MFSQACVKNSVHMGRGYPPEMATEAGDTHPTGMHFC